MITAIIHLSTQSGDCYNNQLITDN